MMTVYLVQDGKEYSFYRVVKVHFRHEEILPLTICYLDDKDEYREATVPIPEVLITTYIEEV